MDLELRAAIKAMARHQAAMADALAVLLETEPVLDTDTAEQLREDTKEMEGLMENLSYDGN